MEKVLVTGGTGFIGVELVQQLQQAGVRTRVLVRRPHRAALLSALDVEMVQGDLASPGSLQRAVEGIDTVFHLGGRASFESYERLEPSILGGTASLGKLAAAAGVQQFVFASSLFVYGDQAGPIDQTTPTDPELGYGVAKLAAEQALGAISAESAMTVASLRFPHVYGPQSILFQQVRRGLAIFPGRLANQCGHLHVDDAARVLVAVARQGWTGASAVADGDNVSWREYFEVLRTFHPEFRLITLPRWLALTGATVVEPLLSRRSTPTLYTRDTVVGFNLNVPVAPGLLWGDLGIEPVHPSVRDGIPAALDGYVRYRWRHPMLDRR